MNHNLRIRQRKPLALGAAGQQERSHRTGLSDAHGRYVAADVLHGIVHCHAGRNDAAGRVNVQKDVLFGILGFQKQKLSANQRRNFVVNLSGQKNNPFFQQARKDVKRALALGRLFNDHRHQRIVKYLNRTSCNHFVFLIIGRLTFYSTLYQYIQQNVNNSALNRQNRSFRRRYTAAAA